VSNDLGDEAFAALAGSDRQAYVLLYERYVGRMFSYFAWRFSRTDAADLTSEVFLRALSVIGKFEAGRSWAAWLYGIARNLATEHLRKRSRDDYVRRDDVEDGPETGLLQSEREKSVRAAVATLSAAQREVIELRYWAGLSYRDIASITGRSEGAVRVQAFRTLERLKTFFEEDSRYEDIVQEFQNGAPAASRSGHSSG
jgi:RNA polymerase sigma-70 factor (ECF subfamily)